MAKFKGKFASIVLLGRQNPQILNHDFLVKNGVLPLDQEPFRGLEAKANGRPFTQFISVPVMTTLSYGPVTIVVEENRYQITDNAFGNPKQSPIVGMTQRYFGELLRHTPFTVGGINLNGDIAFADAEEERQFDTRAGLSPETLGRIAGSEETRAGLTVMFPWHKGVVEVQLPKAKNRPGLGGVNFNYEFKYSDIDSFLANLSDAGMVYDRFCELLGALGVEIEA
jgi:hypothetical protein